MALVGVSCLSFQEAEAVEGPCHDVCRVDLNHAARASEPKTLPECEKSCIAGSSVTEGNLQPSLGYILRKHLYSPFRCYARLALCTTVYLFYVLPVGASDTQVSPNIEETASTSTSSTSQTVPDTEEKSKKPGKYDLDRIGQRGIGKGANLYSLEKERALGAAMAAAIDRRTKLVADPDVNDYVNRLGQTIARNSDAEVPFTIKVIDSLDLKAFALPGGFLYVDKGLIMEVDSEAELAGLMAHEIAHVAARHASRSATRRYAWNMFSIPLIYLGGPAGIGIKQIAGIGVPLTFKKFDRDAEIEADLLGIEYQYAAGYDPQAFLEALEKLQSKENKKRARLAKVPILNFLTKVPLHDQIAHAYANYPSTDERIQRVQAEISTLLPSRSDYILDTSEFQEVKAKLAWADRPVLRRHRLGDSVTNGPVLHKRPQPETQQ